VRRLSVYVYLNLPQLNPYSFCSLDQNIINSQIVVYQYYKQTMISTVSEVLLGVEFEVVRLGIGYGGRLLTTDEYFKYVAAIRNFRSKSLIHGPCLLIEVIRIV
jgi:hypothetical protein